MVEHQLSKAEKKMRRGQRLVVWGFVIAIIGIVFYCVVSFVGSTTQAWVSFLFAHAHAFLLTSLGIIALGTLVWLIGSFMHLSGAMEKDPDEK